MAVDLVTVTGNLETLIGSTPTSSAIWFKLNRPGWNADGDIFVPEHVSATPDTNGAFTIALQSTAAMVTGSSYTAIVRYRDTVTSLQKEFALGSFTLTSGGPFQLGDLLGSVTTPPVDLRTFPSRAAFLAARINDEVLNPSYIQGGLELAFYQDQSAANPAAVTFDGKKWLPLGQPYLDHFGAVGDGVANDAAALVLANAANLGPYDLLGKTYKTTTNTTAISSVFFNGTLITRNANGNDEVFRQRPPITSAEIATTGTKSTVLDWSGKRILWLGTSIPHQGFGINSYPEMVAIDLNCAVTNNAWSGSFANFKPLTDFDPMGSINQVKSLSMTDADVAAGLALYGPSSVFSDNYDIITKARLMTCDSRIGLAYQEAYHDVVILDHNHNDRRLNKGTLTPPSFTIQSVTIGATTTLTLSSVTGIVVGSGVAIRVVGIDDLDYAAARVQSVSGNNVVLAYNSTGLSGTFASGTAQLLDRSTLYGSFDFLVSYIRNAGLRYGTGLPEIILAGAPSEYTGDTYDNPIWSVNRFIEEYALHRGLGFYDVSADYKVGPSDHVLYFEDTVHPTSVFTRRALANHWTAWLSGGASLPLNPQKYLAALPGVGDFDQSPLLYDSARGGVMPASRIKGPVVPILSDDWTSGLGAYTVTGDATIQPAPWGVGNAIRANYVPVSVPTSRLQRSVAGDRSYAFEFEFWLDLTVGLTTGLPKTITMVDLRSTGSYISVQAIIRPGGVSIRPLYFKTPNVDLVNMQSSNAITPGVKHVIRIEGLRNSVANDGFMSFFIDGEPVFQNVLTDDAGQSNIATLRYGVSSPNLDTSLSAWLGPYSFTRRDIYSTKTQDVTISGATMRFVNGLFVGTL